MPLTKNINAYADVAEVLNTAHKAGGGEYTMTDVNEAVRWRQRAYYYRILLLEHAGFTKFDTMKLTLEGSVIIINFNANQTGTLTSLDGKKLKPELEVDKSLLEAATKLAEELK